MSRKLLTIQRLCPFWLFLYFQHIISELFLHKFSRDFFLSFVKNHTKSKSFSNLFFKENSMFIRTYKIRLYFGMFYDYIIIFCELSSVGKRSHLFRIKNANNSICNFYLSFRNWQTIFPTKINQFFFWIIVSAKCCSI